MGGKSSKGGPPKFVREGTKELGEKSQQLWDISKPLVQSGADQAMSLIRTGGPGANVPIINQAVAAQRGATQRAQAGIDGDLRRAGMEATPSSGPFAQRLRELTQRRGDMAAANIPIKAAAPLITSAMTSGISGGRLASAGFQGGLDALTRAAEVGRKAEQENKDWRRAQFMNIGSSLASLGMGFGGGSKVPNQQNPYGSGMSPTGSFLIGPSGTLGGGV